MSSDDIAAMLGLEAVSKCQLEAEFAARSDEGPVHCRFVDVLDTHSWTLRFWKEKERPIEILLLPAPVEVDHPVQPPHAA
jgi:hypothetical protein